MNINAKIWTRTDTVTVFEANKKLSTYQSNLLAPHFRK